jgi:hypothetical protein
LNRICPLLCTLLLLMPWTNDCLGSDDTRICPERIAPLHELAFAAIIEGFSTLPQMNLGPAILGGEVLLSALEAAPLENLIPDFDAWCTPNEEWVQRLTQITDVSHHQFEIRHFSRDAILNQARDGALITSERFWEIASSGLTSIVRYLRFLETYALDPDTVMGELPHFRHLTPLAMGNALRSLSGMQRLRFQALRDLTRTLAATVRSREFKALALEYQNSFRPPRDHEKKRAARLALEAHLRQSVNQRSLFIDQVHVVDTLLKAFEK